jgi:hypothetical protein
VIVVATVIFLLTRARRAALATPAA